jgi:hypothetical protein
MKRIAATRRRFFSFMAAAPIGAKAAAEQLAGIASVGSYGQRNAVGSGGLSGLFSDGPVGGNSSLPTVAGLTRLQKQGALRAALLSPEVHARIESIIFEDNRMVAHIDHDLASKRSFSLAAKVTFQRQRNVARQMSYDVLEQTPWRRLNEWSETVFKTVFGRTG